MAVPPQGEGAALVAPLGEVAGAVKAVVRALVVALALPGLSAHLLEDESSGLAAAGFVGSKKAGVFWNSV
jgi:hypothetical protein